MHQINLNYETFLSSILKHIKKFRQVEDLQI